MYMILLCRRVISAKGTDTHTDRMLAIAARSVDWRGTKAFGEIQRREYEY